MNSNRAVIFGSLIKLNIMYFPGFMNQSTFSKVIETVRSGNDVIKRFYAGNEDKRILYNVIAGAGTFGSRHLTSL